MKELNLTANGLNLALKKDAELTDNEIILEGINALIQAYNLQAYPKGEWAAKEDQFYADLFAIIAEKLYNELDYIGVDEKEDIPKWPIFHSLYKNLQMRGLID